jgi:hypothetical protein
LIFDGLGLFFLAFFLCDELQVEVVSQTFDDISLKGFIQLVLPAHLLRVRFSKVRRMAPDLWHAHRGGPSQ